MCLGGCGGDSYEPPRYLTRTDPPPGPPSPPDMVNDMEIAPTGNFNRKKLNTDKKPAAQSSKNTGLY